jgi:hypothetical protein
LTVKVVVWDTVTVGDDGLFELAHLFVGIPLLNTIIPFPAQLYH